MDAGIIAVVSGGTSDPDHHYDSNPSGENKREAVSTFDEQATFETTEFYTGIVAVQSAVDQEKVTISSDGEVHQNEQRVEETKTARFALLPDEVAVVESGQKDWALDVLERATGASLDRVRIDVQSFIEAYPEAQISHDNFYGRSGGAETGGLWGPNIRDDDEASNLLDEADGTSAATLSLTGDYSDVRLQITESGYVDVYDPDFVTARFLEFISDEILEYRQ